MLAYEFDPLAEKELDETVPYYEALKFGKSRELLQQIQAAIEQVCQFPASAPVSRGSIRSLVVQPSQQWSDTLHYRVTSTLIRILAVAHQKRRPFYWVQRQ